MYKNEGKYDRLLGIVLGIIFILIIFTKNMNSILMIIFFIIALILIITGILGWCPLYYLFLDTSKPKININKISRNDIETAVKQYKLNKLEQNNISNLEIKSKIVSEKNIDEKLININKLNMKKNILNPILNKNINSKNISNLDNKIPQNTQLNIAISKSITALDKKNRINLDNHSKLKDNSLDSKKILSSKISKKNSKSDSKSDSSSKIKSTSKNKVKKKNLKI